MSSRTEAKEYATEARIGSDLLHNSMRNKYQRRSYIFQGIESRGFSEEIYQPTICFLCNEEDAWPQFQ